MLIQALLYKQNAVQIEPDDHKLLAKYHTGGYKLRPNGKKSDLTLPFLNALTNLHTQACRLSVTTKLGHAVQQ